MAATRVDLPCEADTHPLPSSFLVVHNVSKRANVGTLARCATAFGVEELLLCGGAATRGINTWGAHGAADHVAVRGFASLAAMREYVTETRGGRVVGVEILPTAVDVTTHPFVGPTAFLLGNEGSGLSPQQMAVCDSFIYIPQFGPGTASLNVACAAAIVLHHFATWARFPERARDGSKFVVDPRPPRESIRLGTLAAPAPEEVRATRAAGRAEVVEDLSSLALNW
jgi:tRNA G18 (ribose-2'-O)-methylase SpoU